MRGTVLYGPGDVRFEDREDPKIIKPTDATIRMAATCVCGSDLWPYRGLQRINGPTPMGHEYCGFVEEVGSAVKSVKPGQFVIGSFATSDNTCPNCRYGYQSSCEHREWVSTAQAPFLRVPLADGTLVATKEAPSDELLASLLTLSARDRSIVTLAALFARNQIVEMPHYFEVALDNGMKPCEISEIITHLAFYCGWANAFVFQFDAAQKRRVGRACNKRDLSTGETAEFAGGNVGFGLNPGVASAVPRDLSSNRRESTASQNLRNLVDTGESAVARSCQESHGAELGCNGDGSLEVGPGRSGISNPAETFSEVFEPIRSDGSTCQPKVVGSREHVTIVGPHFALSEFLRCRQVHGVGGPQKQIARSRQRQRARPSQQRFTDGNKVPEPGLYVLGKARA